MSRRRAADPRAEITVYPRAASEQVGSIPPPESGLSVDPEEIGSQFLSSATEQGASEWPAPYAADDGDAGGYGAAGELAETFELDPSGWERAITRSLRIGKLNAEYRAGSGVRRRPSEPAERPAQRWDEIDLTDESIHEASLLDHEGAEFGEVESPPVRTDDTHTHNRPRGGHPRHGRRRRES